MPRSRPEYALEFRQKMVELVRTGRNPEELAKSNFWYFRPGARRIRQTFTAVTQNP